MKDSTDKMAARMRGIRRRRRKFYERHACAKIVAIHPSTGNLIKVNFQRDAMITDLDEDLRRLPGTLAWYLQLRDTAKAAYKEAMHAEHNVEEDLSVDIRNDANAESETLKETEIKMRVKVHPQMRAAFRRRMDAEAMLRSLESAVEAIIEKKWSLKAMVDLRKVEFNIDDNA